MWDCILTSASGCFIPNLIAETSTLQGQADYTTLSTIFHYGKGKVKFSLCFS